MSSLHLPLHLPLHLLHHYYCHNIFFSYYLYYLDKRIHIWWREFFYLFSLILLPPPLNHYYSLDIFNSYCLVHLDKMIHVLTARTLSLYCFLSFFTSSYLPLQYYCCNSIWSSYYWHQCDKRIHFWRWALSMYLYSFLYYIFFSIINNIFISFRPIIYIVLTEESLILTSPSCIIFT